MKDSEEYLEIKAKKKISKSSKFLSNPNFSNKSTIIDSVNCFSFNDVFEVYKSRENNQFYLVVSDVHSFDLHIISLSNYTNVSSLYGHKKSVLSIRYFYDSLNDHEYLISSDKNKIVIVWSITENYTRTQRIRTSKEENNNYIYSSLLLFNIDNNDYIITSCIGNNYSTVYSLNNISNKYFLNETNFNDTYYIIFWHNIFNDNYYIIGCCYGKITINEIFNKEPQEKLSSRFTRSASYISGVIYNKKYNDSDSYYYFCSSADNGYISIWDLIRKINYKNIYIKGGKLFHTLLWNDNYVITADLNNKSFEVTDLNQLKVVNNYSTTSTLGIICIKKFVHPSYGEALLTSSFDKSINLWAS